jgi:hypothetical protein
MAEDLPLPESPINRMWLASRLRRIRKVGVAQLGNCLLHQSSRKFCQRNCQRMPSGFSFQFHRQEDSSSGPRVRRPCRCSCLDPVPHHSFNLSPPAIRNIINAKPMRIGSSINVQ